jgi:integrase
MSSPQTPPNVISDSGQETSYQNLIRKMHDQMQASNTLFPDTRKELLLLREHYSTVQEWFNEGSLVSEGVFAEDYADIYTITERYIRKVWPDLDLAYIKGGGAEVYHRFISDVAKLIRVATKTGLDSLSTEFNPPELPEFLKPVAVPIESTGDSVEANTPLFSDYYQHWLDSKLASQGGLTEKIQKDYSRFYGDWQELMLGQDKPIGNYKKKEIRDFMLKIASAPARNKAPYKGRSISELLELDIPSGDRIAPKTAGQCHKWLQGVFALAVNEDIITTSPANSLSLNLNSSEPFGKYTDEQVCALLSAVGDTTEKLWHKWVIYLAAYTGMRRTEIVQLRKTDIRLDAKSGRHYILVTDEGVDQSIKSKAAKRQVPIHEALLSEGFMELVGGCDDRLFSDLESHSVTGWFGRLKDSLGIPAFNEAGQRMVFHSFRHTVITKSLTTNESVLVQQVVGHEKQYMGITSRYNHDRELVDVLSVIDSLGYRGILY